MSGLIKAVLEWLSGLIGRKIKEDVKASDAETEDEIRDNFRDTIRKRLRDDESSVHKE